MELISRKEALEKGLKRYFTGKPCKYNHLCERISGNGKCVKCTKEYSDRTARFYSKKWYHSNKEKVKNSKSAYYERNKDRILSVQSAYRSTNKESVSSRHRIYASLNPNYVLSKSAKRRADKIQRTPKWANLESIKEIYLECVKLNEETRIPHQVDHIVPLRGKSVCGLHVENNLRIITKEDNLKKSNKFE